MFDERGGQGVRGYVVAANLHEHFDSLAFHWIGDANRRSFCDGGMRDQCAFHLGCADAVSGYVEDIIVSAEYCDVPIFISCRDIARHIATGDDLPIAFVASGILPYGAQHVRKWTLEHQASAHSWRNWLAIFIENIGLGSGQRYADLPRAHRHRGRRSERRSS